MKNIGTSLLALAFVASVSAAPLAAHTFGDRAFVISMLQLARGQAADARLAEQRASSPRIRWLAHRSTREWSGLRSRLTTIAYEQGDPTPGALTVAQRSLLDRLSRTEPRRFDAVYLRVARAGYNRALSAFSASRETSDRAVVALIDRVQPRVRRLTQIADRDVAT